MGKVTKEFLKLGLVNVRTSHNSMHVRTQRTVSYSLFTNLFVKNMFSWTVAKVRSTVLTAGVNISVRFAGGGGRPGGKPSKSCHTLLHHHSFIHIERDEMLLGRRCR